MAEDGGAPGADVIDVFDPIDIPNSCAFRTRNEKRIAADIAKRADWRIDATGNSFLRTSEKF